MKRIKLHSGTALPPPNDYEEGDLFMLYPPAELYVRSGGNWVLIGSSLASAVVTDGANVGTGTGEVFRDKTGTILNFRTLKNNDGSLVITTSGDEVNIDINTSGPSAPVTDAQNVGGAYEVFRDKTGNTLNFRTMRDVSSGYEILAGENGDVIEFRGIADSGVGVPLISGATLNDVELKGLGSSDGSIFIDDLGSSIDLVVDPGAAGLVTDGQNIGSGIGNIFAGKSGTVLTFRTLDNTAVSGAGVLKGDNGNEIEFRKIVAGGGINVVESADSILIESFVNSVRTSARQTFCYPPSSSCDFYLEYLSSSSINMVSRSKYDVSKLPQFPTMLLSLSSGVWLVLVSTSFSLSYSTSQNRNRYISISLRDNAKRVVVPNDRADNITIYRNDTIESDTSNLSRNGAIVAAIIITLTSATTVNVFNSILGTSNAYVFINITDGNPHGITSLSGNISVDAIALKIA